MLLFVASLQLSLYLSFSSRCSVVCGCFYIVRLIYFFYYYYFYFNISALLIDDSKEIQVDYEEYVVIIILDNEHKNQNVKNRIFFSFSVAAGRRCFSWAGRLRGTYCDFFR